MHCRHCQHTIVTQFRHFLPFYSFMPIPWQPLDVSIQTLASCLVSAGSQSLWCVWAMQMLRNVAVPLLFVLFFTRCWSVYASLCPWPVQYEGSRCSATRSRRDDCLGPSHWLLPVKEWRLNKDFYPLMVTYSIRRQIVWWPIAYVFRWWRTAYVTHGDIQYTLAVDAPYSVSAGTTWVSRWWRTVYVSRWWRTAYVSRWWRTAYVSRER